ncbi:MAG: transcription antitermination factor NusB [Planctomycetota bacterium]
MSRIEAWKCLRAPGGRNATPLREVDRVAAREGLDARDRGLLRALVGHEVRRRATLRALVEHYSRFKPNPDLAAHMRLGLVQVLFLDRIPDHAAVSETVDAVSRTCGFSKTKYVNAILRAAIRDRQKGASGDPRRDLIGRDLFLAEPVFRDPEQHPFLWAEDALSVPAPLYKRWSKRFGDERTRELATYFLAEPPLCLRGVGIGREELLEALRGADVPAEPGAHPRTVRVPTASTEAALASEVFTSGRATVQGESSLAAAELVGAQPDESILDLCAAPGGKTAVMLEAGARVTAVDDDPGRLSKLRETLQRLGHVERAQMLVSDGTHAVPAGEFDAVLVDAPCSNTGVLGARPGARWRFGPQALTELGELQTRLLREGAERVRPGGRLVWSTCSLEPDENAQRVRAFLADHPGFELAEEREGLPGVDGPVDGGYAALLHRR